MGLLGRFQAMLGRLFASAEDPHQDSTSLQPREVELLRRIREALADLRTEKLRLDARTPELQSRLLDLQAEARGALEAGRDDLACLMLLRRRDMERQLEGLQEQVSELAQQEARLALAEQWLSARIDRM